MSEEETKTNLKPNDKEIKEKTGIPVSKWSVDDVCKWVEENFGNRLIYTFSGILINAFEKQKVDGELFLKLDDGDLESLGLNRKFLRTKFLHIRDKLVASQKDKHAIEGDKLESDSNKTTNQSNVSKETLVDMLKRTTKYDLTATSEYIKFDFDHSITKAVHRKQLKNLYQVLVKYFSPNDKILSENLPILSGLIKEYGI